MTVTISRLYNNYGDARVALQALEAAGVKHGDISVLASNADDRFAADPKDPKKCLIVDRDLDGRDDRAEGAGAGASVGAAIGGAAGLLTGLGVLAIPGVGPVVAAGWLVATLTGAAAGGATGGLRRAVSAKRTPTYTQRGFAGAVPWFQRGWPTPTQLACRR
jgi:hypothetical protein